MDTTSLQNAVIIAQAKAAQLTANYNLTTALYTQELYTANAAVTAAQTALTNAPKPTP